MLGLPYGISVFFGFFILVFIMLVFFHKMASQKNQKFLSIFLTNVGCIANVFIAGGLIYGLYNLNEQHGYLKTQQRVADAELSVLKMEWRIANLAEFVTSKEQLDVSQNVSGMEVNISANIKNIKGRPIRLRLIAIGFCSDGILKGIAYDEESGDLLDEKRRPNFRWDSMFQEHYPRPSKGEIIQLVSTRCKVQTDRDSLIASVDHLDDFRVNPLIIPSQVEKFYNVRNFVPTEFFQRNLGISLSAIDSLVFLLSGSPVMDEPGQNVGEILDINPGLLAYSTTILKDISM